MTPLVHQPENIKRLVFDVIVEQMGQRATTAARKSMRSDVISAFPLNDHSHRVLNSRVKIVTKSRRNRGVACFLFEQSLLEELTEDDLHAGSPKTSSNV